MSNTGPEILDPAPPRAAERILQAARKLFYSDGIRAVGVEEIVARAGVTKPSLYRGFGSKDELVVAVLKQTEADFWARFELSVEAHPGDARAQIRDFFKGLAGRSTKADHRGCGLSNAMVEYPEPEHGAHQVALSHKRDLRARLRALAAEMGARDADGLGDALLLLIEGAYLSSQIFGAGGPSGVVAKAAEALMDAALD
jgi:AcrR family transcriptional regulator